MSLAGTASPPASVAGESQRARLRMPLALKFAAAVVGLIVFVLVVNGAVSLWFSYREAQRTVLDLQQEKAEAASEQINQFVSELENQIGWTTRAEWRRIGLEQQRYDFIRLLRQAPAITELFYLNGAGQEELKVSRLEPDAAGSLTNRSGEPRFREAVATGTWFGPVYFRRGSEPYMTIAVAHAGREAGVTVAEVNLKLIWDVINAIRVGETGYAFVVGPDGKLIAHPDMSLVLRDTDMSSLSHVEAALRAGGDQINTAAVSESLDRHSVLSAYAKIPRLGWAVFVQSPVGEALAPVYTLLTRSALLLVAGLLLASVVGTWLARRMVVPIRRLQAAAERLGRGDLSERIAIQTGDEIETLADRFNVMAGRIQDSHESLEAKVEERTRDLGEALHQQTATAEVLKVISRSAFDLKYVLNTLVESAARLCEANSAHIIQLVDGAYRWVADFGFTPEFEKYMRSHSVLPGRGSVAGRAILEGRTVQINDVLLDAEYSMTDAQKIAQFRTLLGVPMVRGHALVGVLVLHRTVVKSFTEKEIALVQTFADQAVIAIENVRLFEEVQARTAELGEALGQQTATADVLKVISRSTFDLGPVLQALAETATRVCEADRGAIMRRDEDQYVFAANAGFSQELVDYAASNPLKPGPGSATFRAADEKKTVLIVDVLADPSYTQAELQRLGGYRTMLAVPLVREGTIIGVFLLTRADVRPFSEKQIELVESFADQAVIAIQNVTLFEQVRARTSELSRSLEELRTAQNRLVQTEKLASLGQLTAGIAHEIKNPLNFVNNFSALSGELVDELREVLRGVLLDEKTRDELEELASMLKGNLDKVVQHGKRADSIVKNMLLHSREGAGEHRPVNINAVVEESLNLAYHGARAEKQGFNITLEKSFDPAAGEVDLYPQEITRVLLNLISNGFYATVKRGEQTSGDGYQPVLAASTRSLGDMVEIRIRDNGTGIPPEVQDKMFNPFFTTKPAGEGTGLGLSLSHDIIVKQHAGSIEVDTTPGEFTEFRIVLPRGAASVATIKPGHAA